MRRVSFLCTLFMIAPTLALGCSEPSSDVRIPRAPSKISQPSCVLYSNCSEYDMRSYKNDVATYIRALTEYAEDAADAADAAKDFASDAADYARCEGSDASSRIR